MLRSNSPKQLKNCLSNSHLNCYSKDSSGRKNSSNQVSILQKKISNVSPGMVSQKYAINKGAKGTVKLGYKYDPNKKYLFNNTTYGTPLEKSAMNSYVSTPH